MRKAMGFASLVALLATLIGGSPALAAPGDSSKPTYRVFVFHAGASGAIADAGASAIRRLGKDLGFAVEASNDPNRFTEKQLSRFRAVVFLGTTGNVLNGAQQDAFEAYFRHGGGFVGIGSAIETENDWAFLTEILGTRASGRTAVQAGTIKVADRIHEATKGVPEYWVRTDAWYNFTSNVRGASHVLATVVEDPFGPQPWGGTLDAIADGTMGSDHPIAWCKDWKGGRSFYTAGGNTAATFGEAAFRSHLGGAIVWAAGLADPVFSDCGATVTANYQMQFVAAQPNISEPIGFDVFPDGTGRVIQTDRRGGVRLHDPETNSTTLLATIPVYTNSEDGLYGPEVDPDFEDNGWVYLFYAPPTVEDVELSDGSIVTQTTVAVNDPATPANEANAPTIAPALSAWDPWIGYFQLSRFKFVEASGSTPAHLDLDSEQQILRVPNNRGACCHVAGDIDFDSEGNLWIVTGDDTPAGGGNSGGFGPFNDQLTNESQVVSLSGATGGSFTLTFEGQTTAAINVPVVNTELEVALENLSNVDDVLVTGTNNRTVRFDGPLVAERDVELMTANGSGLTGTSPTVTVAMATVNNGRNEQIPAQGGMFNAPHVDARRTAQNTNDLRGKILRLTVKTGDIGPAEENQRGDSYTIPTGNLFAEGTPRTAPEIYAMGFRNPFRITLDKDDVAYVTDYSPDSQTPTQFRGPAGTGRVEIVREPANYGWPICYRTDLPYYRWNFNTTTPLDSPPQTFDCDDPAQGPQNSSRWVADGGPTVEPGLEFGPPITNPEIWYSFTPENQMPNPRGTPCFAYYGPDAQTTPNCPRLFPELLTGGVGPHGASPYDYDPDNPNPTKFPPYWDGAFVLGEFTRDFLREIRLDSQDRVFKISNTLPCGQTITSTVPFLCDNPMDQEFGPDGTLYLLTYGDGFFLINPDAAMERFSYVKGTREPIAVISAEPTSGQAPLTVQFSSDGSQDPDPGDSISFAWDFDDDGTIDSIDPDPSFTYTATGVFTARLTVSDSSGKSASANTTITVGNTAPTVDVTVPVQGGTFAFGDEIPFTVEVSDPEDGTIHCAEVTVTFVLGHDTHGHAQASTTGCSGVLPTDAADVSHGGNVFGVVSATYTDHGGSGVPVLTAVDQHNIRQKRQEVEAVTEQAGTNIAATNDPDGGGQHRSSLSNGDWIRLNGPFNLLNIDELAFRVASTSTTVPSGSPMAAVEVHLDAVDGPLLMTANLTSTGNADTWSTQSFAVADPGDAHHLFLVFRSVTGGQGGNNLFNLNWVEFVGAGISSVP